MKTVYSIITDRILAMLDQGTVPWRRPWSRGQQSWPKNLASKKQYRGINVFLLSCSPYECPYWLTFNQAKSFGGTVRKGEHGTPVVFWTTWTPKNDRRASDDEGDASRASIPVLRYYTVFNASQCEGIEERLPADTLPETFDHDPIKRCDSVVSGFAGPVVSHGSDRAYYRMSDDIVAMPNANRFGKREEYYSTLFHELSHATGHPSRLARKSISEMAAFGTPDYGTEELIAEMGAAFLCGHCGIETATIENSASYIDNWRRAIKQDKKLVVTAAGAAQKAADMILGLTNSLEG